MADAGKHKVASMVAKGKKKIKEVTDGLGNKLSKAKMGIKEAIQAMREFLKEYNPGSFGKEWAE